jgi:hypothetical protein
MHGCPKLGGSSSPPLTMVLREHVLRAPPTLDDTEWRFVHVPAQLVGRQTNRLVGKCISFTHTAITLRTGPFPVNRVIHCDDPLEFVLVGFGEFRSEVFKARAAAEYMVRFFKAGLFLNGVQYRFYGHSNSQLVCVPSRSVFLTLTCDSADGAAFCAVRTPTQSSTRGSMRWVSSPES